MPGPVLNPWCPLSGAGTEQTLPTRRSDKRPISGNGYRGCISYSYTMVLGIYGSKPTEPEGKVVYVAINP